jgi:hypothetical protein
MRSATCLFFLFAVSCLNASVAPLTVKEVALMLRSGYASDSVLAELAKRKCADTPDATTEKQLLQAGASQALLEALRSGAYQLSPQQIATTQDQRAAQAYASQAVIHSAPVPLADSAAGPAQKSAAGAQVGGTMYEHLKDDLVYWHEGTLVPFDNEILEREKFYLLFFSAIWSKEGRQFTSQLADYYNRVHPQHPEFEIVFFSADRSSFAMENYISQTSMAWPVVAYDKLQGKAGALAGPLTHQIPRLILADASGRILSDSGEGRPEFEKVLAELDKVLAVSN